MLIRKVSRTTLQQGLTQRSGAFSIPKKIATPMKKSIIKWHSNSGEEWTSDRLKAIKLDIIRKKAGLQPVSSWISCTRKHKFRGAVGTLENWMLRKESNFKRGLQLLQCYTLFYAPCVTEKQLQKWLPGVKSNPLTPEQSHLVNEVVLKGWTILQKPRLGMIAKSTPLELMIPSSSKRAPLPEGSVDERFGIIDSIRYLYDTFEGVRHLNRFYESHYKFVIQNLESTLFNDYGHFMSPKGYPIPLHNHGSLLVGRIGLIQEPGYKLRAVANPGRVFQHVLKPLQNAVNSFIHTLPWDCTHDQSKGFHVLQSHLAQGKTIHSIDLSGATDYFPLSPQENLLRHMIDHKTVDLFCELSRGSWFMPGVGEISWTRGQPLGLNPSFSIFALTHGLLLLGLLNRPYNNDFYVLGDDVVILDDQLAQDYLSLMNFLDCPIAKHKSLSSNLLCEFGGKLLTPSSVIPQLKWRNVSDDSFLDLARAIGSRSISIFRPRQVKVIKELSSIPEFFGGLGWNPNGLPLESRIKANWIWAEKSPVDHLMGYSSNIIQNFYNSELVKQVSFNNICKTTHILKGTELDQSSSYFVNYLLGNSFKNFPREILGKNVDLVSVLKNKDITDLPINPGEDLALRPSLLKSWELKLFRLR